VTANTKIICTIGPASSDRQVMERFLDAGMNVARINFSHGTVREHERRIRALQELRRRRGTSLAVMQDLSGPKIRVDGLPAAGVRLEVDRRVHLTAGGTCDCGADPPRIPVSYPKLADDIPPGTTILLDDGRLELEAEQRLQNGLACRVVRGGILSSHKGVNFPGRKLSAAAPTEKDLEDLRFGVKMGVDWVALSFVQSAADVTRLKEEIRRLGGRQLVIAKLEREAAIDELQAIIFESDAVMVARGDLGIEADIAMVPVYQQRIIRDCNASGTPVIVATQMMESMMHSALPTRAEANDVATAIFAGTDAIMLSGETAVGEHPVETVEMMRRIADRAEGSMLRGPRRRRERAEDLRGEPEQALANAVCSTAEALSAKAIIAQTISGATARLIARNRPATPIYATTPDERTYHQLSLVWGVRPLLVPDMEKDFMETVRKNDALLAEKGILTEGDLAIISAGIPPGRAGGTNLMKLHRAGRQEAGRRPAVSPATLE